jgi:hypothetical protein
MASRNNNGNGGGWIGALIVVAIVLFVVFWILSSVGNVLGLTPTYSEAVESPDGWVSQHYRGVVVGYALTVAAIATFAMLLWLGVRTQSEDPTRAAPARTWLRRTQGLAAVLVLAILVLPIGKRSDVVTADAGDGAAANAGNVPNVVGMSASKAEDTLDDKNLGADFREYPINDDRCKVVAQNPAAGAQLDEYEDVVLRCKVKVPNVVGRKARAAEGRLIDAGLDARFVNEPADYDLGRCRVRSQNNTGSAAPDARVKLRLRCSKPEPDPAVAVIADVEPEPANDCDPNYTGACLDPNSPDYDCAGGEGDGPDYTGTVTVVGDDHYDLNRDPDEDNIACDAS